jgi:hypothetical protein
MLTTATAESYLGGAFDMAKRQAAFQLNKDDERIHEEDETVSIASHMRLLMLIIGASGRTDVQLEY